ncbi:MAG: glycoside hydrolase family 92 protein [Ignavibacteria bacterium]|jgi:predicted alpha-1,2-mannosidase|nr:glycoside hydrolase family 92 protein [Ignavibacteria bacterium]MCU7504328.1 glycoside hydrolase family 92 protein [Ignavibacteria bacterium]MCU7518173.1 glycoside hydrolase family 92 protein [Ignavibacteria bacterium]
MKKFCLITFGVLLMASVTYAQQKEDFTRYVNTFIGTAAHGHTFPGAALPFSMVQPSPDTDTQGWDWCSGYNYSDSSIMGFSHTHLSGTGVGDMGDFLIMPEVGVLMTEPGDKHRPKSGYRSRFSHGNEIASPGYYSVFLDDPKVKAELTATLRAGFHKYTFPESESAHFIIDLRHTIYNQKVIMSKVSIKSNDLITGYHQVMGMAKNRFIYFAARFSKPFDSYGLKLKGEVIENWPEESSDSLLAYVNFRTRKDEVIYIKVGISYVSTEEALKNVDAEIPGWDFEKVRLEAKEAWNRELSKAEVEGTDKDKTIFYTALYHSFLTPNLCMDASGSYRGYDGLIHKAEGFLKYSTFSLWDTFRAAHPLYTLLVPEKVSDFVNSLLADYKENTFKMLPIWPLANIETWAMIGYHSVSVIAEAYIKGIRGYDMKLAFEAMKMSATCRIYEGLEEYMKLGYVPADHWEQSASKTLEYAFDDWCIARAAKEMGLKDEYGAFLKRSDNYRNVFDRAVGFARGRNSDGTWRKDFNPLSAASGNDFTEGNSWQYTWFVPQDVPGLIGLIGGNEAFVNKLDSLFRITGRSEGTPPDVSGTIGQYAHGNEPGHHTAYLYSYAGYPWKTQEKVREIMALFYTDKPDGLCGNEDCGQMSAWYVMSALGFYAVNPASGMYVLGSPALKKAKIRSAGGNEFVIEADNLSVENVYVKSVLLNGKPYHSFEISHKDLLRGGSLQFTMSKEPEKSPDASLESKKQ